MQSNELTKKFHEVIQPYFAQLSNNKIGNLEALKQYIQDFDNDNNIVAFLQEQLPSIKAVMSSIDSDNQKVFSQFVKNIFFTQILAQPLATTVLQNLTEREILDFVTTLRHEIFDFEYNNVSAYFIQSNFARIMSVYYVASSMKQHDLHYNVPQDVLKTVVDLSSHNGLIQIFADKSTCNKLYSFAYNPAQFQQLATSTKLRECALQHHVIRAKLATPAGMSVYFDAQGNQYVNRIPFGVNKNHKYVTCDVDSIVSQCEPSLIKFDVNVDVVPFFVSNSAAKALSKHHVSLLASVAFNTEQAPKGTAFDLNQSFADCLGIAALIERMTTLKTAYDIKFQLDIASLFNLQILFCAKEK